MDGYGKRVLVVDDDDQTRLLMGDVLERDGYNVVPVRNGLDALAEVKKRHFDAVITGYAVPILNGQQFVGCIRAMRPEMPVILVSAELPDYLGAGQETPFFACLRKPFDDDVLLKLLRAAAASQVADRPKNASRSPVGYPALLRGNVSAGPAETVQPPRG
jgi:CheY-like chemotaxis protein